MKKLLALILAVALITMHKLYPLNPYTDYVRK